MIDRRGFLGALAAFVVARPAPAKADPLAALKASVARLQEELPQTIAMALKAKPPLPLAERCSWCGERAVARLGDVVAWPGERAWRRRVWAWDNACQRHRGRLASREGSERRFASRGEARAFIAARLGDVPADRIMGAA